MRKLILLIFLLCVAAFASADEWNKTYAVSGKPALRVHINDGPVHVTSSDAKELRVTVVAEGWQIPKDVRVTEHQTGNNVDIDVHVPNTYFGFGHLHRTTRIEVVVPREADLDIDSGDGRIEVTGVSGSNKFSTGDGRIECSGLAGTLHAKTGDGRIIVRGRFDDVQAHTNDGRVELEVEPGSKMASTWTIRTGDGSVSLRLPGDFQADLYAHTGDGHIETDFPITVSGRLDEHKDVRAKLNGGGNTLEVHTGDGSIRISKL